VLVLTQYDNKEYIFTMLKAGVAGYILKKAAGTELVSAIRAVHSGESFLHPAVARTVVDRYVAERAREEPESSYEQLSGREKEVLKLLAEGHSNRDIAELLSLSAKTVMAHRANIMEKLDIHNRTELVKFAIRVGLVDVRA
jgi:DNA-binding NarL/FixJ family response regulator